MLDHRQIATGGVAGIHIEIAPKDQTPLVRLADIKMPHAKAYDVINTGLQPLGDKGL